MGEGRAGWGRACQCGRRQRQQQQQQCMHACTCTVHKRHSSSAAAVHAPVHGWLRCMPRRSKTSCTAQPQQYISTSSVRSHQQYISGTRTCTCSRCRAGQRSTTGRPTRPPTRCAGWSPPSAQCAGRSLGGRVGGGARAAAGRKGRKGQALLLSRVVVVEYPGAHAQGMYCQPSQPRHPASQAAAKPKPTHHQP